MKINKKTTEEKKIERYLVKEELKDKIEIILWGHNAYRCKRMTLIGIICMVILIASVFFIKTITNEEWGNILGGIVFTIALLSPIILHAITYEE